MKAIKLLAALMPTLAVASNAAAQVSTITVVTPVATSTHTKFVWVTASAGPTVSTCLASFCAYSNASASELSTIRLISFTTATTTKVITPPDSTTTIDHATDKSLSTSCVMPTRSTITVTVTETSIPVITKSVYPIPASSDTNEPATHTPSYPSKSPSSTGGVPSPPPYLNGSTITITTTMTNCTAGTTAYMPLHTGVLGAAPDNAASLSAMLAAMSSSYPVNTIHGPVTNTEGVFFTSSSGRLRPLQLFALLARITSFANGVVATDKVSNTTVQHIESRFYPYPAPLNSGPPPHLTNLRRDIVPNTTIEVNITTGSRTLETLTTTSTFTLTVTDTHTSTSMPPGPWTFSFSDLTHHSVLQTSNGSSSSPGLFATFTTDSVSPVVPSISGNSTGSMSLAEINGTNSRSVHHTTVLVTITESVIPMWISANTTLTSYATLTSNVTNTIEKQTTHTATVTKTTNSFTEGVTPTAAGIVEELNFFLCYAMIATWFILFVVA